MYHQPIRNRVLAVALALAMLLALIPSALVPTATAESLIPESVSRVVYVSAEGSDVETVNGSIEDPFKTLEYAMERLSDADSTSDAVIVIVGTVTSSITYNITGTESHTGTYYITGKYGDSTGGILSFYKSSNSATNYNFGGPVVIENLTLTQGRNKNLNIHTSTSLIIGENVTTGGDYSAKISIIGGDYNSDVENTVIKISSGTWSNVRAGNNTKNVTGTTTITVGGTATVTNLYASGNVAGINVEKVVMNINAGTVTNLYYTGSLAGSTNGNVTVNLNAGTVGSIKNGAGSINENSSITVNVGENFVMGELTMAVESALGEGNAVTTTLNLGEVDAAPAETLTAEFDTVNYTLPPAPAQIYVDGTATETGTGSKDAPFQTLQEAYAYIAANAAEAGGQIVISGNTKLTANTNLESNTITGLVTLTSANNAVLSVSGSSSISLYFGPKTKFENISLDASEASALFLFTGAEMTLGEGITTSGTLKIFCCDYEPASSASEAKDVSLTVQSGDYDTIFMGSNTAKKYVGDITLSLEKTADLRLLVMGPNKGHAGNLTVSISTSKTVDTIANTPNAATANVGDVVLNLQGCTVGEMRAYSTANSNTYYAKSFTVNVGAGTTIPATFGVFSKMYLSGTTDVIPTTMNLDGYTGEVTDGALAGYSVIHIKNSASATYAGTLTSGQTVSVEAGSTLTLSGYNEGELPDGVTVNVAEGGTLLYADSGDGDGDGDGDGSEPEESSVVYVDGTVGTTGDGSKDAPFLTLQEAYAYIAEKSPAAGGTVVIKGNISLSGTVDLESNYAISGQVEITSKYGSEDYTSAATVNFVATSYFYPTAKTYIHDISFDSTGYTTYFYTNENMVLGENVSVLPVKGKYGLKLFTSKLNASASDEISVTINSGLYHSIFMGGRAGSTAGNISVTMNGGTVTTYFVLGPNSSVTSPSSSGNLTATINGGTIAQICSTPDTAATTGDVVVNLNNGTISAIAAKGTNTTMKSVTVNVANSMADLPDAMGSWEGSTVTNGATLNLNSVKGNADISGYNTVNLNGACEITSVSVLSSQNITVGANSILVLTYPTYTGVDQLPENVTIKASVGGTVTDAACGKVYYKEITYPEVVYVDGTVTASGDGLTPETAVKTLPEAYALLSPIKGGTVVLSGKLEVTAATNLESVTGKVIITSVYNDVDYRKTAQASLNFPESVRIYFGDETYIRDLSIVCGSGTVYVYCGADMTFGEGLSIDQSKTFKIFTTDSSTVSSADAAKDYKLTILSGDYESVWMGGLTAGAYIGNVEYTQGGTASVRLLVMAGNKGTTGNITANMLGGTVTKLTTNGAAAAGLTVGDVVVNLMGCAVKALTSYGGNDIYGNSFTVNVYMDLVSSLPSQMGYYDQSYLPGTTTRIPLTLNFFNYNGASVPVDGYDVINIFGGSQIPDDYVSPAESGKSVLSVNGYTGILNFGLTNFNKLVVTGNADVTCVGTVPTSLVLSATDSKLRIRPSQQSAGITLADYVIVNNDQVLWEEPAYTEHDVIFSIDFENEYAATGNVTVNSVNNGYTTSFQNGGFVTGVDGKTGLYLVNEFGAAAQNYLTVDLTNSGYDITKEDYTVTFWYRTENGGNDQWARSVHATVAGTEVNMPAYNMGGTIFSNQDTKLDTAGMSFLQLTHYKYTTAGFTAADGTHCDADGIWQAQDDTWHHVVVSYDRDGAYCVYVDGELITITDISAYENDVLGVNALTFGADALGQYGLGNAIIDNITVFSGALNVVDAQAQYYASCIDALAHEINTRLEQVGAEYDTYKANMVATLDSILSQSANLGATEYATLISLHNTLLSAYESFMAAPEKDALLTMLLTSDIHFGAAGTVDRFDNLLGQLVELGVDLDVIMSSGDFADKPDTSIVTQAYEDMFALLDKHGLDNTLFVNCLGNHDAYYRTEDANYQTAIPLYWQYMMGHMEEMIADGRVTLDYAGYYVDDNGIVQSCSYAVTYQGYHFLAINTDYPEGGQTGNSGLVLDKNGNYSIEGNEVDPIRHTMHLKDETLEWMDEILDKWAEDGMPVFATGHYLFENTCPLSFNSEIIINSNTIGKQDQQLREILAAHKNVFYFCGHVHASLGVIDPWLVEVDNVGSFWELNLSAIKASARAYLNVPSTWVMYVYEDEVVLRARDFSIGEWLTEFDVVIKLACPHLEEDVEHIEASAPSCDVDGNSEYWHCTDCGGFFSDAACTTQIEENSWILAHTGHDLTHYDAVNVSCDEDGNSEYWHCTKCGKFFSDAACTTQIEENSWILGHTGHDLTHYDAVEPTPLADGNIEYWRCGTCGAAFADEDATLPLGLNRWVLGATVDNGVATIPDSFVTIPDGEDIVIDVSDSTEDIESVVIGSETLDKIVDANTSLEIKLSDASVSFDATALESISTQAGDASITIIVNQIDDSSLTDDQVAALEDENVYLILTVEVYAGDIQISNFNGGKVTVSVPFEVPEGKSASDYYIAYVADDGTITALPTTYADGVLSFETTRFSNYVVLEKVSASPDTSDSTTLFPAVLIALLGITGTALLTKKRIFK